MSEHKNMERALTTAAEYRTLREQGHVVLAEEARRTIEELVGYFDDGTLRLPRNVREAMGVDAEGA